MPEDALQTIKIWPGKNLAQERQTIKFELPQLPNNVFKIVVPELISDTAEAQLPWGHLSPDEYQIEQDRAAFSVRTKNVIDMQVRVLFEPERIEAKVKVKNLSERTWDKVNAFTCFWFEDAPDFLDFQLTRSFVPVNGEWKSIADLLSQRSEKPGPLNFFKIHEGPDLEDLWVCRQIKHNPRPVLSHGSACMVSKDGQWIAGVTTDTPAYVFDNPGLPCLHADPLLGTIEPGQTAEGSSIIHIFRGSVADFGERCRRSQGLPDEGQARAISERE